MKHLNKQLTAIASILIFSIGLMLSCNVFAAKPLDYAIGGVGPGGGYIFFVTDDGKHGLEVAQSDLPGLKVWGQLVDTNAARNGVFGGRFNTDRIIGANGMGDYAALSAANATGGGYGDWYLPSPREFLIIGDVNHLLPNPLDGDYWTSMEYDTTNAHGMSMPILYGYNSNKSTQYKVRHIRAF